MNIEKKAAIKRKKPRMSLLPGEPLWAVAEVLTFGAIKYEEDSWKKAPFKKADYLDALMRHQSKILEGELRDEESGLLHAAHMACDALMYLWYVIKEDSGVPDKVDYGAQQLKGFTEQTKHATERALVEAKISLRPEHKATVKVGEVVSRDIAWADMKTNPKARYNPIEVAFDETYPSCVFYAEEGCIVESVGDTKYQAENKYDNGEWSFERIEDAP